MEPAVDKEEQRYFRTITLINQLSYLVSFFPILAAILANVRLFDYIILVGVQIVILLALSSFKYRFEKKMRKIEEKYLKYIIANSASYALISVFLPVFVYLVTLFYSLAPVVRLFSINVLFLIGFAFLLSNLPASRLKRISKPLADEYLISQASEISSKLSTGKLDIYVIDMDKFKIANAGQVGARKYSVFISSYLLSNLTKEENVAVIAHEFAHAKKKHVLKNITFAWLAITVAGNLLVLPWDMSIHPLFPFTYPFLGFIILIVSTIFILPAMQRRFETQADLVAASVVDGNYLISALQKITRLNLTPGELSKYWNLDHPSTKDRVRKIREYSLKHEHVG